MNTKHLANPREYPNYVVPGWKLTKSRKWECIPKPVAEYGKPMHGLTSTLILTDNMETDSEQLRVSFDVSEIKIGHLNDFTTTEEDGRGLVLTHYNRDTQAIQKTFFTTCGQKAVTIDQAKVYWPEDPRYQQFYFLPALSLSTAKTCLISNIHVAYNDPAAKYWTPVFQNNTGIKTFFTTPADIAQELKDGKAIYTVTLDFISDTILLGKDLYLFSFLDDQDILRYVKISADDQHLRHNLSPIVSDAEEPPTEHDLGLIEADKDYRLRIDCTYPIKGQVCLGLNIQNHETNGGFAGVFKDCIIERMYVTDDEPAIPHTHYLDFQIEIFLWQDFNPNTHDIYEVVTNAPMGWLDTVPPESFPTRLWKEYTQENTSKGVISDDIINIEG